MPPDPEEMKAFRAFARGRVQGVGFRYSAISEARRLRLSGTVRNCADGSVEVTAEGGADGIALFMAWLRKGPPLSHVRELEVQDIPYSGNFSGFDVEF